MRTRQSSLIFHYDILSGLAHQSTTDYLTKTNFEKVPPFWVKGPKNREQTEGASFTEVFLLFLTKESASRLPCARTVT